MKQYLTQAAKARGVAVGVHFGLWLLLYLAVTGLGGKMPELREATSVSAPAQSPAPVAKLERLFSADIWPKSLVDSNRLDPFFTSYFIPPPTPAPPPPTTRKIELTYQGFFQTGDSAKEVIVKMADKFLVAPIGSKLTANLFAAEASFGTLTLTNPAAQTNILPLNTKKEIEVPIQ